MTTFAEAVVRDKIKGLIEAARDMGTLGDPNLRAALLSSENFHLLKRYVLITVAEFGSVTDVDAALAAIGGPTDEALLKTLLVDALDTAAEAAEPALAAVN